MELGSGDGELYEQHEDPQQLVNRFDDPSYAAVREQMQTLLRQRPGAVREVLAEPIGMA